MHYLVAAFFVAAISVGASRAEQQGFQCPKAMFWFGDSIADTGNVQVAFPFVTPTDYRPYGMTYFGKPSGRFCDGRLISDFFAHAFQHHSFLDPILKSVNPDFGNGANFAVSGATALNTTYAVPFYLQIQIDQFLRFKQHAYVSKTDSKGSLFPDPVSELPNALHALVIHNNDLLHLYQESSPLRASNASSELARLMVESISHSIKVLYENGARNFMIFNTFPHGCMPLLLSVFDTTVGIPRDSRGCIAVFNNASDEFNRVLREEVEKLRKNLMTSHILYADVYRFTLDVLDNPANYGFKEDLKLMAACGSGPYNFNFSTLCGSKFHPESSSLHPWEYISWDGVHFTEAFYKHLSLALLSGKYIEPAINLKRECNLDFSKFCQLMDVISH